MAGPVERTRDPLRSSYGVPVEAKTPSETMQYRKGTRDARFQRGFVGRSWRDRLRTASQIKLYSATQGPLGLFPQRFLARCYP